MPHKKSRETINREKKEAKNRFYTKVFGVSFILVGVFLELFHSINETKVLLWGKLFNVNIYTSSILIILGVVIVLASFKRIMDLLKRLKIFQNK